MDHKVDYPFYSLRPNPISTDFLIHEVSNIYYPPATPTTTRESETWYAYGWPATGQAYLAVLGILKQGRNDTTATKLHTNWRVGLLMPHSFPYKDTLYVLSYSLAFGREHLDASSTPALVVMHPHCHMRI